MFKSFAVENFRCLKRLELPRLGRVNLIAGKNDVGKTSLLEAIFLHLGPANAQLSHVVNVFRGLPQFENDGEQLWGWLFHGFDCSSRITLASEESEGLKRTLTLSLGQPDEYQIVGQPVGTAPGGVTGPTGPGSSQATVKSKGSQLVLDYSDSSGKKSKSRGFLHADGQRLNLVSGTILPASEVQMPKGIFLSALNPVRGEDAIRFDGMVRQRREAEVIEALRIIEPRIQSLFFGSYGGLPIVRVDVGLKERMPISLLGDGPVRLLRHLIAIADAPGGIVLIDEIENGFHHSILAGIWRSLWSAAEHSNVQLFATTHSWECIQAAAETFKDADESAFAFHRLEQSPEGVKAVTAPPQAIEAAVASGFEVR